MATKVTLECYQCGENVPYDVDDFFEMVKSSPNTRINLEDSGSLNLRLWCCYACEMED